MINFFKNKLKSNKNHESQDSCNEIELQALLKSEGAKFKEARFNNEPARYDFQEELKQKILSERPNFMKRIFQDLKTFFSVRKLAPAVALVLIISLVAGALVFKSQLFPGGKVPAVNQFSKLIINQANAMDNFELKPEKADTAGVDSQSAYILTSKDEVDLKQIEDNLIIEPKIKVKISKLADRQWQITPEQALPAGAILKVTLAASYYDEAGQLNKRDYRWAYQVKDSFKVLNTIPRDTGTNVPTNSGIEITFSHDNFKDFEKYISIEPELKGRFEKHNRTLAFVPAAGLKTGAIYKVTVKAGLPLAGSEQELAEDFIFQFETAGADSFYGRDYFNVYDKLLEFSTAEQPVVQVAASNAGGKVSVKVYKFASSREYLNVLRQRERLPWWSYSREAYNYDTSKLKPFITIDAPVKSGRFVQYVEFPEKLPAGYYVVDLSMRDSKQQAWFQVTDLSAYLNVTKTQTIVWVNDLAEKKPAVGAKIKVAGLAGEYLAADDGIAAFATWPDAGDKSKNDKNDYLEISSRGKTLILPAKNDSRHYYYNTASLPDDYWRYLYVDRPKYQPSDTIKYWGMIKRRDQKTMSEKVTITLLKEGYFDYSYKPVYISEQPAALNDLGVFSGEIALKNIRPDYYVMQLRVGDNIISSNYIEIRPYTKPAYQLSLIPEKKAALAGETVNLKVQASFFEGTPVPNLPLVFKMPEGEYKFTTNQDGQANLTYTVKYYDCHEQYVGCWPDSAWLRISPQASELAEISAEASIRFYGGQRYAKVETEYPRAGAGRLKINTYHLDLKQAEAGGWRENLGEQAAGNTKIQAEVFKITYTKTQNGTFYDFISKRAYPNYEYHKNEAQVDNFTATTNSRGEYVYEHAVEPETTYKIRLKVFDEKNHYDMSYEYLYYNDGTGLNRYESSNYDFYNFDLPDKKYNIGDQVEADMRNGETSLPDGGRNRYLFLQLANGLQEYQLGDNSTYRFNFEERDVPNVNLTGVYYNGRAYFITQARWYSPSGQSAVFDPKNRLLEIGVTTDKKDYKPGENITLSLEVKDQGGRPAQAAVNVNVVDEAYYAVADDLADPAGSIYAAVNQGSYLSEYSHKTITDKVSAEGGGCFLAGTRILLADGTTKPIEKIQVDDRIKTLADPIHLKWGEGKVAELFKHTVGGYLIINDRLRLTPEHRVYSNYSFRAAAELKRGDWLLNQQGEKIFIESLKLEKGIAQVYNFRVEPQHTYIADGFYVHNDKGGGAREYLADAPLFTSVKTDKAGRATVSFKLPDNITAWRVTTQAVSQDLRVGTAKVNVNVSLPVFIDATIGNEYLTADKPIARVRAYGTALTSADQATFNYEAPTLGAAKSDNVAAKAFVPAYLGLPKLSSGKHLITYNLNTAKGKDALKLPLNAVSSRLSARSAREDVLSVNTKIEAAGDGPIEVLLGDSNRLELYRPLIELGWSWTDRIDQLIARKKSKELLNLLFGQDLPLPAAAAHLYQQSSGGVSLLPYSSEDLLLTAKLADSAADDFDKKSMQQYFLNIFNDDKSNREQVSAALYGLAALDTPILPLLNNWLAREDLSVKEKLLIGLAFSKIGATEKARTIYYEIATKYGLEKLPSIKISIDNDAETTRELTALTAVLAAEVQAPEKQGYWHYLNNNYEARDTLIDLEKISYVQAVAPYVTNAAAKAVYEVSGQKKTVDFNDHYLYSFQVAPDQAKTVKFLEVAGKVSLITSADLPFSADSQKTDDDLSLSRKFFLNGKEASVFKENDTIEVRLYPKLSAGALDGKYQIIDILPSGLLPVTKFMSGGYGYGYGGCGSWYPYDVDGQKVKYIIWKNWNNRCSDYISYFARVKNKGEYKVEPAVIQSMVNPEYLNFDARNYNLTIK